MERLRSFAEIVASGGIMAAAGDDPNRQNQLSRQLKELERYFGVGLIRRGRGRMQLTLAGRQLHRRLGMHWTRGSMIVAECLWSGVRRNESPNEGSWQSAGYCAFVIADSRKSR
ncbi:MAG TPA: LysR family transcriptional regulator [Verrucomicrobiota bacterium]|nr:LysR family transcriptional regulator [Verrucomicrobiota bacterium]